MPKRTIWILLPLLFLASDAMAESSYSVRSPDGRIEIRIQTGARITYGVLLNIETTTIAITRRAPPIMSAELTGTDVTSKTYDGGGGEREYGERSYRGASDNEDRALPKRDDLFAHLLPGELNLVANKG